MVSPEATADVAEVLMIRLVNVSRTFHGRGDAVEALRSVDLSIRTGEFVAIVGRSGCGKSTLLRLVAGLIPPTDGEVVVDDEPVTGPRRDLAMVFQKASLLPWRNVLGNVLLPVDLLGLRRRDYRQRAMELLELVGLAEFHRSRPHELSGGMQQRVALCRSLLVEPRALLMDEPFSALDALTREELSVQLQQLHMERSTTVLFVTHSIDEAILLADRVVVLSPRPGRIKQIIPVELPRPRTLGRTSQLAEMARLRAELHELLMTDDLSAGGASAVGRVPGPRVDELSHPRA